VDQGNVENTLIPEDDVTIVREDTLSGSNLPEPRTFPSIHTFQTLARGLRAGGDRKEPPKPGTRLHRYALEREIGRGGTSTVFEARHIYLDYSVALKVLTLGRGRAAELFLREARALARLHHPGVVRVIDAGLADERPYIALEFLRGKTLQALLRGDGQLSHERALDVLESLGDVLALQEERGIVHRDIKPGNIVERNDGMFCLIDYGLVGLVGEDSADLAGAVADEATLSGKVFGTPSYMSPEQALGHPIGARSDLFSLGCSVWHSLAGRAPRTGTETHTILLQAATEPLPLIREVNPDVPREVESILLRLTALDPSERFSSATEMLEDIFRLRYEGRRPSRALKGMAFLAMPYDRRFDSVCRTLEDGCEDASLQGRRVDRLAYTGDIWTKVVDEIRRARLVVADFTGDKIENTPNPNVVTEAAYAQALGKPLVVMSQDDPRTLPFDWRGFPVVTYDDSPEGLRRLRGRLTVLLKKLVHDAG